MESRKKTFQLKLAHWQQRLVQDFLELTSPVDMVTVKPGVIKCPASYKIPVEGLSRRDWILYLTDDQMGIVQKEFDLRAPVSGINITAGQIERGDVVFQERSFRLKLASWQSRMVKDFLETKTPFKVVVIKPGVIKCPASYKIPVEGLSRRDWVLYLTDEQMDIVQEEFGLTSPVSGINVTAGQIEKGEVMFQ